MSKAKDRVIQKAETLFMKHGYLAVTMEQLGVELGMKPASIYYHFPKGKEELYVEVVKNSLNLIHNQLVDIASDPNLNFEAKLHKIGNWAQKELFMSPLTMYRIDLHHLSKDHVIEVSMLTYTSIFTPIKQMLQTAYDQNEIRKVNEDTVAGIIIANLEGISQGTTWQPGNKSEIWASVVNILLHGLVP